MLLHLPRILAKLTRPDGPPAIALATARAPIHADVANDAAGDDEPTRYSILGYRQTEKPASKGGRANANYFRIRHKGMRAFARSFKGNPFITGHDWGDVRARGGTIVNSWAQAPTDAADELGVFCTLELVEEWAKRGFKNGTIDRFSMGAFGLGEITCTIHDAPVWSLDECWCWPGLEVDGQVCEWEYEDAVGKEMSGVNVPAVDGTAVLDDDELEAVAAHDPRLAAAIDKLQQVCGRSIPGAAMDRLTAAAGGAPRGGFPRGAPPITMASQHDRGALMDRALICQALGLPATATDEEILAKQRELAASAAQVAVLQAQLGDLSSARERDALNAHVETEIARVRAARQVGDAVVTSLRATVAPAPGASVAAQRATFDASLRLVEASAPPIVPANAAPATRTTLQSDSRPANAPGGEITAEVDAYEQHKHNPHLARMMKRCGLSAQQVREHGSAIVNVVPELKDKIQETAARGA